MPADPDLPTFALLLARAAGVTGVMTREEAVQWWSDLYHTDRQTSWLDRAEQYLLEEEKTDLLIDRPGDDDWTRELKERARQQAERSKQQARELAVLSPSYATATSLGWLVGGIAGIARFDRLMREFLKKPVVVKELSVSAKPSRLAKPSRPPDAAVKVAVEAAGEHLSETKLILAVREKLPGARRVQIQTARRSLFKPRPAHRPRKNNAPK
jgi:hypothetical protein